MSGKKQTAKLLQPSWALPLPKDKFQLAYNLHIFPHSHYTHTRTQTHAYTCTHALAQAHAYTGTAAVHWHAARSGNLKSLAKSAQKTVAWNAARNPHAQIHVHTYRRRHAERQPRRPSFLLCRCLAPLLEFIIHFRWYPLISCATRHWPIDGVSLITFRPCHLLVLSHTTLFSSSPHSIAPLPTLSSFCSLHFSVFSFCLSAAHWRQLICASLCLSLLINAPGSCCCCCFFLYLFSFLVFLLFIFIILFALSYFLAPLHCLPDLNVLSPIFEKLIKFFFISWIIVPLTYRKW